VPGLRTGQQPDSPTLVVHGEQAGHGGGHQAVVDFASNLMLLNLKIIYKKTNKIIK
jgi:hypothetical protein